MPCDLSEHSKGFQGEVRIMVIVVMVTGPFCVLFSASISIDVNFIILFYMSHDLLVKLQDTLSSLCIVNNAYVLIDTHRT